MDKFIIKIEDQSDVNCSNSRNKFGIGIGKNEYWPCSRGPCGCVSTVSVFKDQEHVISARQNNRDSAISTVNVHVDIMLLQ